jgi:hypothetical protein
MVLYSNSVNLKTSYFFSSPEGDVPVSEEMMERPFVLRPLENHPFLSLGDFFHATRDFLCQGDARRLFHLMKGPMDPDGQTGNIQHLIIRYEKYGALYQILSAETVTKDSKRKHAVIAALSLEAKGTLERECDLLNRLNSRYAYPLIPQIYLKDRVECGRSGKTEMIDMALSNWFEGYHEWHFSGDKSNAETISIWNMERGFQSATKDVIREIIHQASKILTLYYDPITNHQIYPWHHGAGDFVVKVDEDGVDVRLISVRGYDTTISPLKGRVTNPLEPILYFFLNMTVRMRIDKLDGMGDPVWAGAFILPAVLNGFLEGLRQREQEGRTDNHIGEEVLSCLRDIPRKALREKLVRQIEMHRETDPVDFSFMHKHIAAHADELYHVFEESPVAEV